MKKENGVTIMTLVVTIIIMVILVSVAGFYSIDSINNSYKANEKKELADVVEYTSILKSELILENFELKEDTVVSHEKFAELEDKLLESQINKMLEVNLSTLNPNYKYHYVTSEMLEDKTFSGGKINVKDANNDYIINFYTGTVVGIYDSSCEISGIIKGLNDILLEVME